MYYIFIINFILLQQHPLFYYNFLGMKSFECDFPPICCTTEMNK